MGNAQCDCTSPGDGGKAIEAVQEEPASLVTKEAGEEEEPSEEEKKAPDPEPAPPPEPEPAPAPVKEPEVDPPKQDPVPVQEAYSLIIEFDAGGESKSIEIKEAPLGISFDNKLPIVVKRCDPESSGAKAGVQPGWLFKSIGGESLNGLDYLATMELLKTKVSPLPKPEGADVLPPGCLVIEFETDAGVKKVGFTKKPFKMTFDQKVPVVVKSVDDGGHAQELGVQKGWQIKSIGGKDVASKDFKSVLQLLQSGSKGLPEAR
jgi:predicted metalloprotease with PDZ domain